MTGILFFNFASSEPLRDDVSRGDVKGQFRVSMNTSSMSKFLRLELFINAKMLSLKNIKNDRQLLLFESEDPGEM